MPEYVITVRQKIIEEISYLVEAKSEEEAARKYERGSYQILDTKEVDYESHITSIVKGAH